jgi:hypothetical protein
MGRVGAEGADSLRPYPYAGYLARPGATEKESRSPLTGSDSPLPTHVTGLIPSPQTAELFPHPPNPFHR